MQNLAPVLIFLIPGIFLQIVKKYLIDMYEVLFTWATTCTYINSPINPVIYFVRNREIRSAIKTLLCRYNNGLCPSRLRAVSNCAVPIDA